VSPGRDTYFHEDAAEAPAMDFSLLRRLLGYLRPHKGLIALALLALVLGTACQLAGPYIVKIVIDRHIMPGTLRGMGAWIALYLGSLAGAMGFLYLQMYAVSILGQRVILAIRTEMFARMERLPVSFFDRTPTGRLMTRLTSDVEALQEFLSSGLVSTIGDAAVLLGIAAILVAMSPPLALVTFAVLPPMALFVELLKRSIRDANREVRRKLARLSAFLQEHVSGVAVVKAFVQEGKSVRRFSGLNDAYTAQNVRLTHLYSVYFPGVELFASVAVAVILWRGGLAAASGVVTLGTLVAFLEYAQKFFNPLKDMSDKYNILQSALVACERIFHILDMDVSPEYREPECRSDTPARRISGDSESFLRRPGEGGRNSTGRPDGAPSGRIPSVAGGAADGTDEGRIVAAAGTGRRPHVRRPPAIEFRDVWFAYPGRRPAGSGDPSPPRPTGGRPLVWQSPGEGEGPAGGRAPLAPAPAGAGGLSSGVLAEDGSPLVSGEIPPPARAEPVLRGVSFALEEGETGAIVGATGAGKTTVLSLLCRFHEISRGRILLFGRDIRTIPREELRGMMSLVLQDPFLFSGTVRSNVEAGDGAAVPALAAADVAAFAKGWEKGLDTEVGERGSRLSVGQRQIVAFARALARDPRILLLDEATSSVDPETEHAVREAITAILPGRTSLVVAHRLSTVLAADRIIVMHKGRVREVGTHRDLLAAGGIYRRLYMLQFGEDDAEGGRPVGGDIL
jgi:ABC-type multidrug transport system fused ATPase/permease subunit